MNATALDILNMKAKALRGKNISEIIADSFHRNRHDAYIAQYLRTGKSKIVNAGGTRRCWKQIDVVCILFSFSVSSSQSLVYVNRDNDSGSERQRGADPSDCAHSRRSCNGQAFLLVLP